MHYFSSQIGTFISNILFQINYSLYWAHQLAHTGSKLKKTNFSMDCVFFIGVFTFKVLSNTDHMTPIPFGHFAIVFTSWYRQLPRLCREDLRNDIMTSWDKWRFPAELGQCSTILTVFPPFYNGIWYFLSQLDWGVRFLARLHFSAEELLLYPRRQRPRRRPRPHTKC